jgi:hypothetical protein
MAHPFENPQPDLFDENEPPVALALEQEANLAMLVEALLVEIATALANGEIDDDQDHE